MPETTNITAPRVPLVDPRTGLVSREWYMFFLSLFNLTGGGRNSMTVADLMLAPDGFGAAVQSGVAAEQALQAAQTGPQPQFGTLAQINADAVPWLGFHTAISAAPSVDGALYWDVGTGTLRSVMADGVANPLGQRGFYRVNASADIALGQVVAVTGAVAGGLTGAPASGLGDTEGGLVLGLASRDVVTGDWGFVHGFGALSGFDTTGGGEAWSAGDIVYLDPAVAGGMTNVLPDAPAPRVVIGTVLVADASGELFVRVDPGSILGTTDSNVQITGIADNDLLQWSDPDARWNNVTPAQAAPVGTVLQVVNATYATQASSTSASYADTGLTATITPGSADNKVLALVNVNGMAVSAAVTTINLNLVRGSTQLAEFEKEAGYSGAVVTELAFGGSGFSYLDEPATASAVTYKVQFKRGVGSGTIYVATSSSSCSITLLEIKG